MLSLANCSWHIWLEDHLITRDVTRVNIQYFIVDRLYINSKPQFPMSLDKKMLSLAY